MADALRTSAKQTLDNWKDPSEYFELQEVLGVGSYGSVHKALNTKSNEVVAVKIIEAESDAHILQKEIEILKNCDSPFVVDYRGTFRTSTEIWITMEYCHAGSVADIMAIVKRSLVEAEVATICHCTLQGLKYLHAKKLIHRDIKAGNILLNNKGEVKLADFGVSAQLNQTVAKRCTVIGTPYWMSPEVLTQNAYSYNSDIWSLGITAIEMALGSPPHSEIHPMRAIFKIPNAPPPTLPEDSEYSSDFREFLAQTLTKNPDKRPSAAELIKLPYIKNASDTTIIHEMVHSAMPEIMDFREKMTVDNNSNQGTLSENRRNSTKIKPIAIHSSVNKSGTYGSLVRGLSADTIEYLGDDAGAGDTMLVLPEDDIAGTPFGHPIPIVGDTLANEKPFAIPAYMTKQQCEEMKESFQRILEEELEAVNSFYKFRLTALTDRISELETMQADT